MLSRNMPIYSLGSLQDRALHLLMQKDKLVEFRKFEGSANIQALSSALPSVKDPHALLRALNEIVERIGYIINYDEIGLQRVIARRQRQQAHEISVVESFSKMGPLSANFQVTGPAKKL
jgi:hypothetical protein